MYAFVFVQDSDHPRTQADLRVYARTLRHVMPMLGLDLAAHCTVLPDCNCGWFRIEPTSTNLASLVSEAVEETYAAIVYGQVEGFGSAAHAVLDAWHHGGTMAVRNLEGSFGAVIIDRRDHTVTLISDVVGQRSLHYYTAGRTLVASPHDLALLSTGDCPADFDLTTAACIAAMDLSPRGKSMLRDAAFCHPSGFVRWQHGRITQMADPVLKPAHRIESGDKKATTDHLDRMIERLRTRTRLFVGEEQAVYTDLTGGFDSRAVLALLLSAADPSRIKAVCNGEATSLDAQIAARVARRYGGSFEARMPALPTPEVYLLNTDAMAFAMSGATNSKRAVAQALQFEHEIRPHAWGGGGETYRGPRYGPPGTHPALTRDDALTRLKGKTRIEKLPWQDAGLPGAMGERFDQSVDAYAAFSSNGYDIIDLFKLYERETVWGCLSKRFNWTNRGLWNPYMSPQLVRDAFRMPVPIRDHATIHEALLQRYMPGGYWMLVNGNTLAPFNRWARTMPLFRHVNRAFHGLHRRAQPLLKRGQVEGRHIEQIRADAFSGTLSGILREVLTEQGSLTLDLFGREGIGQLLEEHISGRQNHTQTLGCLVTVERWRVMAQETAHRAAASTMQYTSLRKHSEKV